MEPSLFRRWRDPDWWSYVRYAYPDRLAVCGVMAALGLAAAGYVVAHALGDGGVQTASPAPPALTSGRGSPAGEGGTQPSPVRSDMTASADARHFRAGGRRSALAPSAPTRAGRGDSRAGASGQTVGSSRSRTARTYTGASAQPGSGTTAATTAPAGTTQAGTTQAGTTQTGTTQSGTTSTTSTAVTVTTPIVTVTVPIP